MGKFQNLAIKASTIVGSLGALVSQVAAYDSTYDMYTSTADTGALAGLAAVNIIVLCCSGVIALLSLALWVWMLIDVLKRTEAELPDKTTWIIVVVLLGGLGALIYFFAKRRELVAKEKAKK